MNNLMCIATQYPCYFKRQRNGTISRRGMQKRGDRHKGAFT